MSRDTRRVVSAVKPQRGLKELQEIMHASSIDHVWMQELDCEES